MSEDYDPVRDGDLRFDHVPDEDQREALREYAKATHKETADIRARWTKGQVCEMPGQTCTHIASWAMRFHNPRPGETVIPEYEKFEVLHTGALLCACCIASISAMVQKVNTEHKANGGQGGILIWQDPLMPPKEARVQAPQCMLMAALLATLMAAEVVSKAVTKGTPVVANQPKPLTRGLPAISVDDLIDVHDALETDLALPKEIAALMPQEK